MQAMLLEAPGQPLRLADITRPLAGAGQIVVQVQACGVCRTDLHVMDGELPNPAVPLVLGHEIVGRVVERGPGAERFAVGDRVGIPWLGWACGQCRFCVSGRENLCPFARFTGYTLPGGYAEYARGGRAFCVAMPEGLGDVEAAPLLCAGLIGYRALRAAGDPGRLGSLRLWRVGAHRGAGRATRRAAGLRVHEAGGHERPGLCAGSGSGVDRRL